MTKKQLQAMARACQDLRVTEQALDMAAFFIKSNVRCEECPAVLSTCATGTTCAKAIKAHFINRIKAEGK